MPDSWGHVESPLPEHGNDVHVLRSPLDPDDASIQQVGKRRVDDEPGWRLVLDFEVGRGAADLLRALRRGLYIVACRRLGAGSESGGGHRNCHQQYGNTFHEVVEKTSLWPRRNATCRANFASSRFAPSTYGEPPTAFGGSAGRLRRSLRVFA